jgi:2-phosphosulfolactate phosphatase
MHLDAVLTPADIATLPKRDLSDVTCVVFDILRATSTMVTALANGALEIYPVRTIEEARALKKKMPEAILGGERHGDPIEGFDVGNNPLEYTEFPGRRIITTTTNGTVALRACEQAGRVIIGSLLNLNAVRDAVVKDAKILLVCAGTFETFALEDAIAAGALASRLPAAELTDAARVCISSARHFKSPLEGLLVARNGAALLAKGWRDQVEWCAQLSRFDVVGAMSGGIIQAI